MTYHKMSKADFMAHDGMDWVAYYRYGLTWRRPVRSLRWLLSKESRSLRKAIIKHSGVDPLIDFKEFK